ncbi:MAG: DNA modification methyltransferase [Pirellulaceae bacterium]|nr:MAG: DNA modification methyltransferase [Pirellulaceae bacterium]
MTSGVTLSDIDKADAELTERFRDKLVVNYDLDRTLVSFQANKLENEYRWCKYKEGFSAALIRYIFNQLRITQGRIIDPFAGSGTTLFVASERGVDATGIELLPIGTEIIEVRRLIMRSDRSALAQQIRAFSKKRTWEQCGGRKPVPHLQITSGAYPPENEAALERYLFEVDKITDKTLSRVLRFAAMCILESISYTRKDGQYLRWDERSGRRQGRKTFNKGRIYGFTEAIVQKLEEIAEDIAPRTLLFPQADSSLEWGEVELLVGSCLNILPTLDTDTFDALITSPPYCNRYDYTRTYALELALLGIDGPGIRQLRQNLISCTVENRHKEDLEERFRKEERYRAVNAFQSQRLLQLILSYLEQCKANGTINNPGIPRMVRNYFFELAFIIADCARVLKAGAPLVMVNDNVRYQGAHIPVDLILSDMAEKLGFEVETIWLLPKGKGNSSQQMGAHGRKELRKCIYVWRVRGRQATPLERQAVLL